MNNPMHRLASLVAEKFILADAPAAAKALEGLATHEILLLIGTQKASVLVACLNPMSPAKAAAVLRRLPLKQACYVLTHLDVVQSARLWKEFSAPYQERLKSVLESAFVELISGLDKYPPQSAARYMQTDFMAVRTETTVGALIEQLKNLPRKKLPNVCFVTAKNGELKGVIRTAELSFYGGDSVCGSVMHASEVLLVSHTAAEARILFEQAQTDVLPLVDGEHLLLGFVEKSVLPTAEKASLWKRITQ